MSVKTCLCQGGTEVMDSKSCLQSENVETFYRKYISGVNVLLYRLVFIGCVALEMLQSISSQSYASYVMDPLHNWHTS